MLLIIIPCIVLLGSGYRTKSGAQLNSEFWAGRHSQLTQRLDESHMRLRDEFQSRDDRLIQSLTDAMDRQMLQMFAFCRHESRGGPFDRPPRGPPDPPPTA